MPKLRDIVEHDYPHTNLNDYNLDWLIKEVQDLKAANTWVLEDTYEPTTRTLTLRTKSLGED